MSILTRRYSMMQKGGLYPIPFATATWAQIKAIADAGEKIGNEWYLNGVKCWAVGDEKTVTLTDGEEVVLQIYDFEHDDKVDGGKAPITIGCKNLLATPQRMNATATNAGGWAQTEMRTVTLPAILQTLPVDLQSVIATVYKKSLSDWQDTTQVATTEDKLFLLATNEAGSGLTGGYKDEGKTYAVFPGTPAGRIKTAPSGSAARWWMRSLTTINGTEFICCQSSGWAGINQARSANQSNGNYVCFAFCI